MITRNTRLERYITDVGDRIIGPVVFYVVEEDLLISDTRLEPGYNSGYCAKDKNIMIDTPWLYFIDLDDRVDIVQAGRVRILSPLELLALESDA